MREKRRYSPPSKYVTLSKEELEILRLKRDLDAKTNLAMTNQHQALVFEKKCIIKDNRIEELERELEEVKELLADNDIEFGDMINQSDRGYEMRYD